MWKSQTLLYVTVVAITLIGNHLCGGEASTQNGLGLAFRAILSQIKFPDLN